MLPLVVRELIAGTLRQNIQTARVLAPSSLFRGLYCATRQLNERDSYRSQIPFRTRSIHCRSAHHHGLCGVSIDEVLQAAHSMRRILPEFQTQPRRMRHPRPTGSLRPLWRRAGSVRSWFQQTICSVARQLSAGAGDSRERRFVTRSVGLWSHAKVMKLRGNIRTLPPCACNIRAGKGPATARPCRGGRWRDGSLTGEIPRLSRHTGSNWGTSRSAESLGSCDNGADGDVARVWRASL